MIPPRKECLALMARYGMLENIVEHSLKVAEVALVLAGELNKKGHRIDLALVEAASLLHDITKTVSIRTREDHSQTGYELLTREGFERVGEVVRQHVRLSGTKNPVFVSEEEIVNYADKRVRHDKIVPLQERMKDLRLRYGKNEEALHYLDQMGQTVLEIEKKIFSILETAPDDFQFP